MLCGRCQSRGQGPRLCCLFWTFSGRGSGGSVTQRRGHSAVSSDTSETGIRTHLGPPQSTRTRQQETVWAKQVACVSSGSRGQGGGGAAASLALASLSAGRSGQDQGRAQGRTGMPASEWGGARGPRPRAVQAVADLPPPSLRPRPFTIWTEAPFTNTQARRHRPGAESRTRATRKEQMALLSRTAPAWGPPTNHSPQLLRLQLLHPSDHGRLGPTINASDGLSWGQSSKAEGK